MNALGCLTLLIILFVTPSTQAGRRVALVIGNTSYDPGKPINQSARRREKHPKRICSVLGKATCEFFSNYQRAAVVTSYHYEYEGVKKASGNSFITLDLKKTNGRWKITSYDETVRKTTLSQTPNPLLSSIL